MVSLKHIFLICAVSIGTSLCAQEILKQDFHGNGILSNSIYKVNGQIHFISYYENGKVREMGMYRNGEKEGTWRRFDDQGDLVIIGQFRKDRRVGLWSFRFEYGGGYGKLKYNDGELISGSRWNDEGDLVSSID